MLDKTKEDAPELHAALRDEVRALKEREGLTYQNIADESGIKHGTLTPFMGGTYPGDTNRVAQELQKWLETRKQRARTTAMLPPPPVFLPTPTAEDIQAILAFAQAAPDFGVVVGSSGIGKTEAIEDYVKGASNATLITADPSMSKASNLLSILAEDLGVLERRNAFISRAISARVKGTAGLIIIDEAQHLETKALDQLRTTVLDLGKCGVVVAGNEEILVRLQGSADKRMQKHAQLYSRAGMRKSQVGAKARDISLLLDAWGIKNTQVLDMLKAIARKPGALRVMTKTIRLAAMIAGWAGGSMDIIQPIHVERAWRQLSSTEIAA